MIGKLYKARKGTEHIVRVIGKYREMLKGESLDNTAHTYQVLAQRQKITSGFNLVDDTDFEPFTMELELFLENYEEINE